MRRVIAILPYKGAKLSKTRLLNVLPENVRIALSKAMFMDVLNALYNSSSVEKIVVVTPDVEIKNLLRNFENVILIYDECIGQINAVMKAINYVVKNLSSNIILCVVADIPLLRSKHVDEAVSLADIFKTVVLSPSIDGGTNLLLQYPPNIIKLHYGPNSFIRHLKEAYDKNINVRIYRCKNVELDVDTVNDIKKLIIYCKDGYTYEILKDIKKYRNFNIDT